MEIETQWSMADVWDANQALDLLELAEQKAAKRAQNQARNAARKNRR